MPNNTTYFISDEVFRIRSLHERVLSEWYDYFSTFQIINNYSISLYRQYAIGYPPAAIELQNWHPECIGQPKDVVFGLGLSQDDIQLAMARMFGYTDWEQVIERDSLIDRGFEMAVDLMLSGDIVQLEKRLLQAPQLVNANSPFGHQAGLIHYIAANGVETHRQITPYNAPEILQLLLDMGADHMQSHNIYGGSCTLIELIETSAHPDQAGVSQSLIEILDLVVFRSQKKEDSPDLC